MSCTRADVLTALRRFKRPVRAIDLAVEMGCSPYNVGNILRVLYFMNKADRQLIGKRRYVYIAKDLQS